MRLFVAVWPDVSVSSRLRSLELGRVPGIRPVAPGQLHVTLRFLGEVDEGLLPDLVAALEGAARSIGGPIHCEAGPATAWFPGGRVLQVPVVGLEEAADAVRDATRSLVPAPDHRGRFTGHLTLGRARVGRLPAAGACTGRHSVQRLVRRRELRSDRLRPLGRGPPLRVAHAGVPTSGFGGLSWGPIRSWANVESA